MRAGRAWVRGGIAGAGLYHRYNAALKRVSGDKSRAQMTLSELEAAIGWLERNRLSEHLHLLEGDPRYTWSARKRSEWRPPVGRVVFDRSGAGPEREREAAIAATE